MSMFTRNENTKTFFLRYPSVFLITFAIVLVQAATYIYGNGATDLETARRFGAIQTGDTSPGEWIRMATYLFVQIGGAYHILANVTSLLIFGPPLEKIYGTARFTFLYFATGMLGGLFILLFSENSIAAGASGSIFGLIGLYVGLVLQQNQMITSESRQVIWTTFVGNIIFTFAVPNISIAAHLGGLFGGIILSFFIRPSSYRRLAQTSWFENIIHIAGITVIWFSLLSAPGYLPAATQKQWAETLEQARTIALDKLGNTPLANIGASDSKESLLKDVNWANDQYNKAYQIMGGLIDAYNGGISDPAQVPQFLEKIDQEQEEINQRQTEISERSFTIDLEEQQTKLLEIYSTLNAAADHAEKAISGQYNQQDSNNFSATVDQASLKAEEYNQSIIDLYEKEGIEYTQN